MIREFLFKVTIKMYNQKFIFNKNFNKISNKFYLNNRLPK